MARARSALWLAIPMALAAGAVAWLLLSGPGSRPGEEPLGGADAWASSKGARVDLVLDRGGALKVTVRDAAGNGVGGAELRVFGGAAVVSAVTAASGEAVIDALTPGPVRLLVAAPGAAPLAV